MTDAPKVLFLGPPNAGKSTLFNRLTGAAAHVGNYPGITVEQYAAPMSLGDRKVQAVDLPGTFSLSGRSPEEHIAMDCLLGLNGSSPSVVVMVVDAPRLARSLYLVLQVLELRLPVVVAVNLMDEARRVGREPRIEALSEALGVPCVGVVASKGEGVQDLRACISAALLDPASVSPGSPMPAYQARQDLLAPIVQGLPSVFRDAVHRHPEAELALADWLLLSLDDEHALADVADLPRAQVAQARAAAKAESRDLQVELVARRYQWIDARETVFLSEVAIAGPDISDKLDRWLLHPLIGVPTFFVLMALIFTALFSWADPFIGFIEGVFGEAGVGTAFGFETLAGWFPAQAGLIGLLGEFVVNGLIGGVGAVVVFVPQIAILSLLIAILEDSGYLARAAYLMDRVLRMAGLPGQAFVPLLSGFACAVPAIQATRTLPRYRDRLLTMMVVPLTSCSARLPVYSLMIAALFPATVVGFALPVRPAVLFGMYLFSTVITIIAALVLGNTLVKDRATPAVIELPPWRWPKPVQVLRTTWRGTRSFLREAGGIILVATVVLWALLTFPKYSPDQLVSAAEEVQLVADGQDVAKVRSGRALEYSIGGQVGKALEPAIRPLGFDWRTGIGLVGAFAAREVFVATMGIVYQVGDAEEDEGALRERMQRAVRPDGSKLYTPLSGISLMVFFALAMQCLSTMAVLRRESGGWRWPAFVFVWMTTLAWGASFVVYQGGHLIGLE